MTFTILSQIIAVLTEAAERCGIQIERIELDEGGINLHLHYFFTIPKEDIIKPGDEQRPLHKFDITFFKRTCEVEAVVIIIDRLQDPLVDTIFPENEERQGYFGTPETTKAGRLTRNGGLHVFRNAIRAAVTEGGGNVDLLESEITTALEQIQTQR